MDLTAQDGLNVVSLIEPHLSKIGIHSALGGSLAYRGHSTKDIDIILYNHSREVEINKHQIVNLLIDLGFTPTSSNRGTKVPDVHKTTSPNGYPVDFFFMQRLHIPTK